MDNMNIELDFTGVNAAGGLGSLPAGLHAGSIAEFKLFPDTNRLYAYMITNGIRHRESFGLENANSLPFVKAFLLSAGVAENKLGGKSKVPFHKLSGRSVYFQYTPADTDDNGKRLDGSYARYVFYPKSQWDQMASFANASEADVVIEAPSNGAAKKPKAKAKKSPNTTPVSEVSNGQAESSGDDFDFLLDDA